MLLHLKRRGLRRQGQFDRLRRLAPIEILLRAGQCQVRGAADRGALECRAKFLQSQNAPGVRHCGSPMRMLLSAERTARHARHVVTPVRFIQHQQQRAYRVDITVDHQPPQRIVALGRKSHRAALEVQSRAQDLQGLCPSRLALRQGTDVIEDIDPIEQSRSRPQVRINTDAAEHCRRRAAVTRQRCNCGELAQVEIGRFQY